MGDSHRDDHARVGSKESNNQGQGRTGGAVPKKRGPAAGGSTAGNPTKGGGIVKPTHG